MLSTEDSIAYPFVYLTIVSNIVLTTKRDKTNKQNKTKTNKQTKNPEFIADEVSLSHNVKSAKYYSLQCSLLTFKTNHTTVIHDLNAQKTSPEGV